MRLIDADDMIKSLMDRALYDDEGYPILDYEEKMSSVKSFVDSFPTVDAVPVRHGKWTKIPNADIGICSCCGDEWGSVSVMKYCPNCGAKMEADDGSDWYIC